jgi:hypothetical protein
MVCKSVYVTHKDTICHINVGESYIVSDLANIARHELKLARDGVLINTDGKALNFRDYVNTLSMETNVILVFKVYA